MARPLNAAAASVSATAASGSPPNVVTRWFGAAFYQLHPLLQSLHSNGGRLWGEVEINTGSGLAAVVGKRLARRLGIPLQARSGFQVNIRHTPEALLWQRSFSGGRQMDSAFRPYGNWPDGGWVENTGPFTLKLGVDIVDGGWYWRLREARWHGLPVPLALLPHSEAGKRAVDGRYVFDVVFSLPLLGRVLSYRGVLDAQPLGAEAAGAH
ncbi:uncharacterized protein DUF4166 [Tahibacter aquaticus]|uniref:Uncharacterized protein DUF4166 n=1 Tax=Tahibacter aquaticus TaxID=520092 RepID=A0A4R6YRV4_9GAMM|nr:uncharacterized protein DUF4166 [Tahibacter aquaticus]